MVKTLRWQISMDRIWDLFGDAMSRNDEENVLNLAVELDITGYGLEVLKEIYAYYKQCEQNEQVKKKKKKIKRFRKKIKFRHDEYAKLAKKINDTCGLIKSGWYSYNDHIMILRKQSYEMRMHFVYIIKKQYDSNLKCSSITKEDMYELYKKSRPLDLYHCESEESIDSSSDEEDVFGNRIHDETTERTSSSDNTTNSESVTNEDDCDFVNDTHIYSFDFLKT